MNKPLTWGERFQRLTGSLTAYVGREKGYLARTEFWVYLPGIKLPPQDEIMDRMLSSNPFKVGSVSPIGAAEGMLFSDVRTHIALVLKKHNPQIFRGDNLPESVGVTAEQLEMIAASESVAKVSYISEERVDRDLKHVAFITHATAAIADLGGASLLYDLLAERLWDKAAFDAEIRKAPKGNAFDLHVKTFWRVSGNGSRLETRGLAKVGSEDLITPVMERDQQVIAEAALTTAAESVWDMGSVPDSLHIDLFEDPFTIEFSKKDGKPTELRILRVHQG